VRVADQEAFAGGCLCGAIRYRARGPARNVTHCHCTLCRRASGAAFLTWFSVASTTFELLRGQPARFAASDQAVRTFCARCGTQLTFQFTAVPESIDITVASLDDPDRLVPQDHIYISTRLRWVRVSDGLPQFAGPRQPDASG
jgi:hypothetical protein